MLMNRALRSAEFGTPLPATWERSMGVGGRALWSRPTDTKWGVVAVLIDVGTGD